MISTYLQLREAQMQRPTLKTVKSIVLIFIAIGVLGCLILSCGGTSSDSDGNDNPDDTGSTTYSPKAEDFDNAANQVMAASLATNTATATYSSVQEDLSSMVTGISLSTPGDAWKETSGRELSTEKELYNNNGCPTITAQGSVLNRTLTIAFQEGCEIDEVSVDGDISGAWEYSASDGITMALTLDDLNVEDDMVDGNIVLSASVSDQATLSLDADLTTTDGTTTQTETLTLRELAVICDFNATYMNPEDDAYTLDGTGQYQDAEGNTYTITFNKVTTLFLCYFPVSGTLKIESTNPAYVASVNFGSGTCDSTAVITIGKISREVDLSEPIDLTL